jgi:prephenate dehydratase
MDKIAVLGPQGSFSDMAGRKLNADLVYLNTHEQVFDALAADKVRYAVIAFENQLTGTIMENLDLMMKHDFKIVRELVLPIHHNLCVLPGMKSVKKVYSHPQGLQQCKNFLGKKYELVETKSTSEAFEILKKNKSTDSACIGTSLAAEIYGFEVLSRDIEDFSHNQTRFFQLSKEESKKTGRKSSIIFKVKLARLSMRSKGLQNLIST